MALTDWMAVVVAAGFDATKLSTSQLYEISGALIHDPEVTKRKTAIAAESRSGIVPAGTTQKILLNMTDEERAAARSRALEQVRSFATKGLGPTTRAEVR